MNCISCKEPMIVLEVDQVEIDYCLDCSGVWLDAGELELLLDDPSQAADILKNIASPSDTNKSKRKCPICLKTMLEVTVGTDPGIVLDYCRDMHGFWFDKGELEGVIQYFENENSRVVALLKDMFRK